MSPQQRKALKAKAHSLKPVVMIGSNGLTDSVQKEIDSALEIHELMKVRISHDDREERKTMAGAIAEVQSAELVGSIGHVFIFYRRRIDR